MNSNRLILVTAISISLLVNIPRILFLFGGEGQEIINLMEVSIEDTMVRFFLLFSFCCIVLKFNLNWLPTIKFRYRVLALLAVNLSILGSWMLFFYLINSLVYNIDVYIIHPRFNIYIYSFVMLILLVVSRVIKLNYQYKLDVIEKERLKRQSLQNELAALKNQVNPHFLFNSLNSLSLLVRQDQKAAILFINKLSFLYRYILQSKDQDLVTVKEELKFLESYNHLIKERYRDNFKVKVNVNEATLQKKIPTLALQLLMENAVKHNEISNDRPLHVEVYDENSFVIVKNRLQKRTGQVESTNTGLINLNKRFKLYTNRKIQISKDDSYFIVKIPVE